MRRTGLILTVALVAALILAGCGGQSTPASEISSTLKTWGTDFATFKEQAACAEMSPAEQSAVIKGGAKLKIASCPAALRFDADVIDASGRKTIQNASVTNIRVSGSTATATFAAGTAKLTKIGGHWLISGGLGG